MTSSASPCPPSDPLAAGFATTYSGVIAFIAVAREGSFAKAGDRLGIGRSAVSRNVQKLEQQLDARLFLRTTRSTTLTREGEQFYANCHAGVEQITQAIDEMRDLRNGPPRGHLHVSSPFGFGRKVVAPLLRDFRKTYPCVSVDLLLCESTVDFTSERVDIAFRNGRLEDAQIVAKQVIPMQLLVCGSRDYQKSRGLPGTVDELSRHDCINYRVGSGRIFEWEFKVDGQIRRFMPEANLTYNDPQLVLRAVLDGEGIAQMPGYLVCEFLRSGELLPCLMHQAPDDRGHYICYQSRQHMPARMRAFIDFMTTNIRKSDLQCPTNFDAWHDLPVRQTSQAPTTHGPSAVA